MTTPNKAMLNKNRYVAASISTILASTLGICPAMATPLDTAWKTATLPQVRALLASDSGKVSEGTVSYSGKTVHVVAAASLPGFPFMSFEIHGVTNPILDVPVGATVHVTFINTNNGFGHSFDITQKKPPYAVLPDINPIFAGTGFSPLPHDGKFAYTNFSWHPTSGTYYYVCRIPGHAASGMFGEIVVK